MKMKPRLAHSAAGSRRCRRVLIPTPPAASFTASRAGSADAPGLPRTQRPRQPQGTVPHVGSAEGSTSLPLAPRGPREGAPWLGPGCACAWGVLSKGCLPGPARRSSVLSLSSVSCASTVTGLGWQVVGCGFIIFGHLLLPPVACGGVWGSRRLPGWLGQGPGVGSRAFEFFQHRPPVSPGLASGPFVMLVRNPSQLSLDAGAGPWCSRAISQARDWAEGPPFFPRPSPKPDLAEASLLPLAWASRGGRGRAGAWPGPSTLPGL